jgi:hypothetical protein
MPTLVEIAERLHARRIRSDRWIAKCPAHADRAPSLTIASGREGRVLLHCFAGCPLEAILLHAGMTKSQLFSRPLLREPHAIARDAAALQRQRVAEAVGRRAERLRVDRLRWQWHDQARTTAALARMLATLPDGALGAEALTTCYHDALAELRSVDRALTGDDEWL